MNVRVRFRRNPAGHLDHYYHFLFGALIPLHEWATKNLKVKGFLLEDMGPMNRHVASVPSLKRLRRLKTEKANVEPVTLIGMDGGPTRYRREAIEAFRNEMLGKIRKPALIDVLFVDRWQPTPEYLAQFRPRTEGAQRRSIRNSTEIAEALAAEKWKTKTVQLEQLTLGEQAALFHSARVIVAQHGAGLSNIVFASPKATIIEVAPAGRRHYRQLCECLGIRYRWHGNGGRHVRIRWRALRRQIDRMLSNPVP